jgi:hypothetical protein
MEEKKAASALAASLNPGAYSFTPKTFLNVRPCYVLGSRLVVLRLLHF